LLRPSDKITSALLLRRVGTRKARARLRASCAVSGKEFALKHFDRSQQAPKPPGPEPGYPPGNVPSPQLPDIPVPDPAPPPIENPGDMPLPPIADPDLVTPGEPNPAQTPTRVRNGLQSLDESMTRESPSPASASRSNQNSNLFSNSELESITTKRDDPRIGKGAASGCQ
jgi:hypothetical protein